MNLDELILDPNDFKEVKPIGSGQFGIVKLVKSKKGDEQYALKQIPEETQDSDSQKLFIREILTLYTLTHPCILKISGFTIPSQADKSFYIFTEFMPNGNLKEASVKEKSGEHLPKFNATTKTICLIGISAGMKFIHEKKIMHRDLKPENIFFDKDFHPKIADFGLARLCEGVSQITSNLGTPYFMAPELFDDGKITDAIDVYAFGVLLLSMFDPDFRFDAHKQPKNLSQLVSHIKNGKRFVMPKNVPEAYVDLINRCWSTDPKDRPTFKAIYEEVTKDDKYFIDGADNDEILEYIDSINNFKGRNSEKNEEEDLEEEDTKEFNFM